MDIKKILNILLLFCMGFIISIHFKDSWSSIWQVIQQTSYMEIISLCLITILYFVFDSWITLTMVSKYHKEINFKNCLFCSFYCTFLGIATMGSGAGIGEVHYFHKYGIDSAIASGICIIKYVLKKIIIVGYGVFGFLMLHMWNSSILTNYYMYILIGILLACSTISFLLALLTWTWFSYKVFSFFKKHSTYPSLLTKILLFEKDIHLFQKESKKILKDYKSLLPVIILNICKFSCMYLFPVFHFLLRIPISSYFIIIMIMAVCNMLAGVIPTPYGFGSLEFLCLLLYSSIIPNPNILSMLLLFRFFSDVFPLFIGSLCFLHTKRNKQYFSTRNLLEKET